MHQAQVRNGGGMARPTYAQAASAAALSTLVYRSRATRPFTGPDLLRLSDDARRRNQSESITGLVLYDDSRFFQWLEGPAESLSRVMHSINNDGRHTDIEVLRRQDTAERTFAGWGMKLALPGSEPAAWTKEVVRPSIETIEALRRRPEIAAAMLERLAPGRKSVPASGSGKSADFDDPDDTAALLKAVMLAEVIPELASRRGILAGAHAAGWSGEQATTLATLALAGDLDGSLAVARRMTEHGFSLHQLRGGLFEVAARHLGDAWTRDDCTEFDVTIGLCILQTVARRLEQGRPGAVHPAIRAGSALVVPHPGEPHGLGAALSAHALRREGWGVASAFPAAAAALCELLAARWFDVLDLSLSPALRREDRLETMARTVADARAASRNPGLRVAVSGRLFADSGRLVGAVGADMVAGMVLARPRLALA